MARSIVTLPVEGKVRELDEKVALAARIVAEGHEVILGPDVMIDEYARERRTDVHFVNSAVHSPSRAELFPVLDARGTRILILDTEGSVHVDTPNLRARFDADLLRYVHRYLTWGTLQRDLAVNAIGIPEEKVIVTGIPRFDLLRAPYSAIYAPYRKRVRERYAPFVLVNTNHTRANPFARGLVRENVKSPDGLAQQHAMMKAYASALPALTRALPDLNIILRPHPGENMDTYRQMFANEPRIKVIHEGSVHPWIEEAVAVIHNNCTTGLEAAIARVPVAALDPTGWRQADFTISNEVSVKAVDDEELTAFVRACLDGHPPPSALEDPARRKFLDGVIANVDTYAMDAVTRVVRDACSIGPSDAPRPGLRLRTRRAAFSALGKRGVFLMRRVRHLRSPKKIQYYVQKMSGISPEEVHERIRLLRDGLHLPEMEIQPVAGFYDTCRIFSRSA